MFTALVTFLVTVTMILGGAGAPVDMILENLSMDFTATSEVDPVAPKNMYQIQTGDYGEIDPPPSPDPDVAPDPKPASKDCEVDECPSPILDRVHIRTRDCLNCSRYQGGKPDDTEDPIDVEEPLAVEPVEEDPVEQLDKGQQGPEARTGKEDGWVPPDPNPLPDPTPDPAPVPDPEPKQKDCETDDCPAPAPAPDPLPEPVPVVGDGPVAPAPAPAPEGEGPAPAPAPAPEQQPSTGGGDGDDSVTDGSDNGSSFEGDNGNNNKP